MRIIALFILGIVVGGSAVYATIANDRLPSSQMTHNGMAMGDEKADAGVAPDDIKSSDPMAPAMMHDHPVRNVSDALPYPKITHLVFPDAMDGYNVQILVDNFKFTPASINRAVQPNTGHAHLYVNGQKISRVYSEWIHLPSSLLQLGVNQVTVTLNANDHSEWAIDSQSIASTVAVKKAG